MNRPLRRMAAVVMILFAALIINANWIQAVQAPDLRNASGNSRTLLDEYDRKRGPILVAGKEVARSVPTKDALKYLRTYPQGPLYAHATGFYSFVYGATAIEQTENPVLAGTDARLFVRRIGDLITGRETQGGAVTLTLNPAAQKAAMDGLAGRKGAVVALDPTTGAILAMASSPSYDPSELSSHDAAKIQASYQKLSKDPAEPLLNRALSRTYPPGSTFKLVTLAAALSSGKYTPSSKVPGPAVLDLPQTTSDLPNENGKQCQPGSDTTDLATALAYSCNTTFGAVGLALGGDAIQAQAQKFGFGTDLSVPLPVAKSVFPSGLNPPQTAQSAIGQFDTRATVLQMAMVTAGIANNGVVMKPYLVSEVQAPDLSVLDRTDPTPLSTAVSPQVAAQIREMMIGVVERGTGSNGRIPGIPVAGKTGTAQVGGGKKPHAWFVSFAPAAAGQEARVAVAVILENGGGASEVSGNQLAAPIARSVMQAVLGGGR